MLETPNIRWGPSFCQPSLYEDRLKTGYMKLQICTVCKKEIKIKEQEIKTNDLHE